MEHIEADQLGIGRILGDLRRDDGVDIFRGDACRLIFDQNMRVGQSPLLEFDSVHYVDRLSGRCEHGVEK